MQWISKTDIFILKSTQGRLYYPTTGTLERWSFVFKFNCILQCCNLKYCSAQENLAKCLWMMCKIKNKKWLHKVLCISVESCDKHRLGIVILVSVHWSTAQLFPILWVREEGGHISLASLNIILIPSADDIDDCPSLLFVIITR